jgi:hypothetical protein
VSSRLVALVVVSLAVLGSIGPAQAANDKEVCLDAHAKGQELRLAGKWVAATTLFRTCSAGTCPGPVTQDCTRWCDELHAATPSILVAATRPDGADTVDVTLVIDGARASERLPTTSLELDPGEHTIRLEHAGWLPVEERVVLREREKDRRVGLRFKLSSPATTASTSGGSTFGLVMVGVGAVLLTTGITFGVLGKVREDDLAGSVCGRNGTCATEDVDVVRQRYWIGGITGGAGVLALAVGLYSLLTRPSAPQADAVRAGR